MAKVSELVSAAKPTAVTAKSSAAPKAVAQKKQESSSSEESSSDSEDEAPAKVKKKKVYINILHNNLQYLFSIMSSVMNHVATYFKTVQQKNVTIQTSRFDSDKTEASGDLSKVSYILDVGLLIDLKTCLISVFKPAVKAPAPLKAPAPTNASSSSDDSSDEEEEKAPPSKKPKAGTALEPLMGSKDHVEGQTHLQCG